MNRLLIAVLVSFLVLPFAVFAENAPSVFFINASTYPITVEYMVCTNTNAGKLLGSTNCTQPIQASARVQAQAQYIVPTLGANQYVSTQYVINDNLGYNVYDGSKSDPAYNGCNSIEIPGAYTMEFDDSLIYPGYSMTCQIKSGSK